MQARRNGPAVHNLLTIEARRHVGACTIRSAATWACVKRLTSVSIDPVADPQYTLFSEESVPSVDAKPGRRKDQELTAARRPKHASMLGRFCDTGVYDMGGRGRLRSPLVWYGMVWYGPVQSLCECHCGSPLRIFRQRSCCGEW